MLPLPPDDTFEYVNTAAAVASLAGEIDRAGRAAVDTEADSLHHYYHKVCLIQVAVGGVVYIVDPLCGVDLAPMLAALGRCPLVLHGADYDLRMLRRNFEFRATRIFDTMVAAKLLGYDKISLAGLVERHFGLVLPKQGQKADWSRRPITPELLRYAANDTRFLEALAELLRAELIAMGRERWHEEMCARLIVEVEDDPRESDPEREWRIKGWRQLETPRALAILRELWHWREEEAKRVNLPSFRILGNETMVKLAQWAEKETDFTTVPKLPRNCVGRRLHALRQAIGRGRQLPEDQLPQFQILRKGERQPPVDDVVSRLKSARNDAAVRLGVDPGLLAPASTLECIARRRPADLEQMIRLCGLFRWQAEMVGSVLLAALNGSQQGGKPVADPPTAEASS
jgi:ribonuclease D